MDSTDQAEEQVLFNGVDLEGWHSSPRIPVPLWPGGTEPDRSSAAYQAAERSSGKWLVEDGSIVASQDPPGGGLGGYLVSDQAYGDFELSLEVWPDWPADSGVLVRATEDGTRGFQILLDYRKSGGIGGFYGNGTGSFHALAHVFDVERDADGRPTGLVEEDPETNLEPLTPEKKQLLTFAASAKALLDAWHWDTWNELRIRCVGTYPTLTTWVNGVKLYELDLAAMQHPHYDREAVAAMLGRRGHIALEVHDTDIPGMGKERWADTSVVRWRNLRIRELHSAAE